MLERKNSAWGWIGGGLLMGMVLVGAGGCHSQATSAPQPAVQGVPQPQPGQLSFATQDEAVKSLVAAVQTAAQTQDKAQLHQVLGPASDELGSGDAVEDADALKSFARRSAESTKLEQKNPTTAIVYIGKHDWPFPIPLVENTQGGWFFDTPAGKTVILARRIGRNELDAIEICRTYVQAQREYASQERNGSDVLQYAQHLLSHPGKQDGLYWPAAAGEAPSPLGPLMAQSAQEGYQTEGGHGPHPFHGYYFHILKRQGPAAPGRAYDYVINGNMIAGFALIAWPAQYGSSGITTFIVNHQGRVYQQDLGPDTSRLARRISEYNPDSSWVLVKD